MFWTLCNQVISGTWTFQLNWLGLIDWDSDGDKLSIDQVRWYAFYFYTLRSFCCICASTLRNIYLSAN